MTTPLDLTELGAVEVRRSIVEGATTVAAIVEAALERIASSDGHLRAWVTVDEGGARAQARALDAAMASGRAVGPLHGVPVGIKDIIDVAGLPTTCGAAAFAHRHPDHDATLVARLRAAGAVIVGKTVATEFAYKDPAPTLNPWSADHTPGGSSSGSAAAVAARHVPVAHRDPDRGLDPPAVGVLRGRRAQGRARCRAARRRHAARAVARPRRADHALGRRRGARRRPSWPADRSPWTRSWTPRLAVSPSCSRWPSPRPGIASTPRSVASPTPAPRSSR